MLASWLAGVPYIKKAHRDALLPKLNGRSNGSIEFKHQNISAVLRDGGFQYIPGYKPRSNFQGLLTEVIEQRLAAAPELHRLAAEDADKFMVPPEVKDILGIVSAPPKSTQEKVRKVEDELSRPIRILTNYLEREARNRSLGDAGELFTLNYERSRLIAAGKEGLAAKIEHTAKVRGDYEGYDILSYNEDGSERLIEVKTTKYGIDTPFYVSRNEVRTSEQLAAHYQVYRLFEFRERPQLFKLPGAISQTCRLSATTFLAQPN